MSTDTESTDVDDVSQSEQTRLEAAGASYWELVDRTVGDFRQAIHSGVLLLLLTFATFALILFAGVQGGWVEIRVLAPAPAWIDWYTTVLSGIWLAFLVLTLSKMAVGMIEATDNLVGSADAEERTESNSTNK